MTPHAQLVAAAKAVLLPTCPDEAYDRCQDERLTRERRDALRDALANCEATGAGDAGAGLRSLLQLLCSGSATTQPCVIQEAKKLVSEMLARVERAGDAGAEIARLKAEVLGHVAQMRSAHNEAEHLLLAMTIKPGLDPFGYATEVKRILVRLIPSIHRELPAPPAVAGEETA